MTTPPETHINNHVYQQSGMDEDLSSRLVGLNVNPHLDNPYMTQQHSQPQSPNPYAETPRSQAPYSPLPYSEDGTQYYMRGLASPFQAPTLPLQPNNYPYGGHQPDLHGMNMMDQQTGLNLNLNGNTHPTQTFPSIAEAYAQSQRSGSQPHTPLQGGFAAPMRNSVQGIYRPIQHQQGNGNQYGGNQRQNQGFQQQNSGQFYGYGDTRYYINDSGYTGPGERKKDSRVYNPRSPQNNSFPRINQSAPPTFPAPGNLLTSPTLSPLLLPAATNNYTPATSTYPNQGAGQYGMHQQQGYSHNPYAVYGMGGMAMGMGAGIGGGRWSNHYRKGFHEHGVNRSALLEDFRLNSKQRRPDMKDLLGHIAEFSGDQLGSRFIQQKLESCTTEERQVLFDEILPNAYQLMTDVFGNYVIQKLFELGDQRQKSALGEKMKGHVLGLSMQMYGCRVVQKALEHLLVDQRQPLIAELEPHFLECVKSGNANHVIQRLITLDCPLTLPKSFEGHLHQLATNAYGCRVIQKALETLEEDVKRPLLDEMYETAYTLIEDQFGNYVVQSVLVKGPAEDRNKIVEKMKGSIGKFACHKYASNVLEKALTYCEPEDREELVNELFDIQEDGSSRMLVLLRDQFGNFPLQTAIIHSEPERQKELIEVLRPYLPEIRNTPVGKRLENRIREYEIEGVFRAPPPNSLMSSTATMYSNGTFSPSGSSSTVLSSPERGGGKGLMVVPSQVNVAKAQGSEGGVNGSSLEELLL